MVEFVATPWRDSKELLELRDCLFSVEGNEDKREQAVNKVYAWRSRKELPLLLDSTADIVDVVLQDEKKVLGHNATRMLYAEAVSRFITGLADTLPTMARSRPVWYLPGTTPTIPPSLLETRHCIVHREMPPLTSLKAAAKQCLEWLWEWYWSQLDAAFDPTLWRFGDPEEGQRKSDKEVKDELKGILKTYVQSRKIEYKSRKQDSESEAASRALDAYFKLSAKPMPTPPVNEKLEAIKASLSAKTAANATAKTWTHVPQKQNQQSETESAINPQTQRVLLDYMVSSHLILPQKRELGKSMSGAFLIYTPFLTQLCLNSPLNFTHSLVESLMRCMNIPSPFGIAEAEDPVKEGMHAWLLHVLTSPNFLTVRESAGRTPRTLSDQKGRASESKFVENVISECFTKPTYWDLQLVESVLRADDDFPHRTSWVQVLNAAMNEIESKFVEGEEMEGEIYVQEELAAQDDVVGEGIELEGQVQEQLAAEEMDNQHVEEKPKVKQRGPRKFVGLWRQKPIGALPLGWEDDE